MAYIKKIWKDYPDATTQIKAEDLNNIENGIEAVDNGIEAVDTVLNSGWIDANETWTYSSVDDPTGVITISGDKTSKYSLGMRIKFTNNSNVIYGIITKISYSSPNTTLTFLHEIDPTDSLALHLMENSAITNNYYSSMKAPYDFPLDPDKWTIIANYTNTTSISNPVANTWYNIGNFKITIPIGKWDVNYSCLGSVVLGSPGMTSYFSTLSTANNTRISANNVKNRGYSTTELSISAFKDCGLVALTTPVTYYMNFMTDTPGMTSLYNVGSQQTSIIKAVCAYL